MFNLCGAESRSEEGVRNSTGREDTANVVSLPLLGDTTDWDRPSEASENAASDEEDSSWQLCRPRQMRQRHPSLPCHARIRRASTSRRDPEAECRSGRGPALKPSYSSAVERNTEECP